MKARFAHNRIAGVTLPEVLIATVTAFLVVNIAAGNLVLLEWLGPTAVGIPLIAYWTRKFVGVPRRAAAARVVVS